MAPAWEIWALAGTALLQFAVAYWWWRGPYLEGSRGWVTALFSLNGITTLSSATTRVPELAWPLLDGMRSVADTWTNFVLLGIGLVALGLPRRWPRTTWTLLALYAIVFVVYTPFRFLASGYGYPDVALRGDIQVMTLSLAIIAGGLGLIWRTRAADERENTLWVLALAAIGFRYAELSLTFGRPADIWASLIASPLDAVGGVAKALRLTVMAAAFIWLILRRYREPRPAGPPLYDLSILLLGAGFLYGGARVASSGSILVDYFSLGFVRPLVFLAVQAQLMQTAFRETRQWSKLWTGSIIFLWVLIGLPLGHMLQLTSLSSVLVGLSLGVLALGMLHTARPAPQPTSSERAQGTGDGEAEWPLEDNRVALPEDWEQRVERGYELYRSLEPETRERLDDLSRWERILLALHAAPEGGRIPPYERTTPGLHLTTHCPYSSIGPEISRANDRADRILEDVGLEGPSSRNVGPDEPLIEGSLGQAEGLSSRRVKSYELTDLGQQVAERLLVEVGLPARETGRVRAVLGEAYGDR